MLPVVATGCRHSVEIRSWNNLCLASDSEQTQRAETLRSAAKGWRCMACVARMARPCPQCQGLPSLTTRTSRSTSPHLRTAAGPGSCGDWEVSGAHRRRHYTDESYRRRFVDSGESFGRVGWKSGFGFSAKFLLRGAFSVLCWSSACASLRQ